MRFKYLDLIVALIVVVLNVGWIQLPLHLLPINIILALPLILFLPGYTLTQALFRKREQSAETVIQSAAKLEHPIGSADWLLLSFGLSVAIDVLVGFTLNLLPIGLEGVSWVLSLGLITTCLALVAAYLRRKDVLDTSGGARTFPVRVTLQDCLLCGLALLIAASAIWLSVIRPTPSQASFTQLWILQADQADKTCAVSIGVQSFETTAETYRMVVTINNVQAKTWPAIALVPRQKWVQSLSIPPGNATSLSVEAQLYRTSQPAAVYRDVHLTLYISSTNTNGVIQQQCALEA